MLYFNILSLYGRDVVSIQAALTANINCAGILASRLTKGFTQTSSEEFLFFPMSFYIFLSGLTIATLSSRSQQKGHSVCAERPTCASAWCRKPMSLSGEILCRGLATAKLFGKVPPFWLNGDNFLKPQRQCSTLISLNSCHRFVINSCQRLPGNSCYQSYDVLLPLFSIWGTLLAMTSLWLETGSFQCPFCPSTLHCNYPNL